jgi:hypothetical protein
MSGGKKTVGSNQGNERIGTSEDIAIVTLSDSEDFSDFGEDVMPRGFVCDTDAVVNIVTARGRTVAINIIAHKDYLIAVQRFLVTGTNLGGGVLYAFL